MDNYKARAEVVKNIVHQGYERDGYHLTIVVYIDGEDCGVMEVWEQAGCTQASYDEALDFASDLGLKDCTPVANAVEDAVTTYNTTGTLPAWSGVWSL